MNPRRPAEVERTSQTLSPTKHLVSKATWSDAVDHGWHLDEGYVRTFTRPAAGVLELSTHRFVSHVRVDGDLALRLRLE